MAAVALVAHAQGDGVAFAGVAAHAAGDADGLGGFFGVDHVVTGDGVDGDARGDLGVDRDVTCFGRGLAVTRRVGGGHARFHTVVGDQVGGCHGSAVAQVARTVVDHASGVAVAIYTQRDLITRYHVTAHRAADSCEVLLSLGSVDHVVTGDGVDGDGGF
ncbi:hypothetical protein EHLJMEHL_01765 [Vreelandella titanicae]